MAGKEKAPAVPTGASPHQHANEEELARESSVSAEQKTITDALTPDTSAALAFLQQFRPGGPWVLTAIQPDRKGIQTRTFHSAQVEALGCWLDEHQGNRNLYFHVNPVIRDLTKKAEKADIAALEWLHVDIDPRPGEGIEEERERALRLLREATPSPTVIVDSGGGYQGFWRLDTPIPINGDVPTAEDLERYNIQLEREFSADNCHNVDRIMRLPGTINVPDAKKRKKGRVPRLAQVVEFNDTAHPLEGFTQAPKVQDEDVGFSGRTVAVSGNVERLDTVDDLDQWGCPDWLKVLVVQGNDPDDPGKYPSRSEAYFHCACELVRRDVPDEVIYSILTDANFGISEAILEKRRPEKYALRQIERAHEEAIDPWLRKLNEEFAVIGDMGGKCRVISEVRDDGLGRNKISRQSFEDFRNRFRNRKVTVGTTKDGRPVEKAVGAWWLDHPQRRQFDRITFLPGRETAPNVYNLWKGFAVDALPGDKHQLFLEHMRENVCAGEERLYRYLLGWMARAVQQPDSPGEVAVVLRGGRGTGKSMFANIFGKLFGRHAMQVADPKHLVGSFNAHLRDCVVLFGDEAFYAGDKKHESVLKTIVTEETLVIEGKGVDAEVAPNYTHLIMASNEKWVVPAGEDERRFFVLDVSEAHKQDKAYFGALRDAMDSGGLENLLHFLLSYDLSGYEVRDVPNTAGLEDQKALALPPVKRYIRDMLVDGMLPPTWLPGELHTQNGADQLVYKQPRGKYRGCPAIHPEKLAEYLGKRPGPRVAVGREDVKEAFLECLGVKPETVTNSGAKRLVLPASLSAAREAWDAYSGYKTHWPSEHTRWQDYSANEPLADAPEPEELSPELYELLETAKALPRTRLQALLAGLRKG